MHTIYLHGLGQTADSWKPVLEKITLPGDNSCPDLVALLRGREVSYSSLYQAFSQQCSKIDGELTLCGLSLGAVLALNYAIDHPGKVEALVLIAPQYKMPKKLLWLQNLVFRLMPESQFRQTGCGPVQNGSRTGFQRFSGKGFLPHPDCLRGEGRRQQKGRRGAGSYSGQCRAEGSPGCRPSGEHPVAGSTGGTPGGILYPAVIYKGRASRSDALPFCIPDA